MTDLVTLRAVCLFFPIALLWVLWVWRRPNRRLATGTALAVGWNLLMLFPLHWAAQPLGWWHFEAQGGLLLGLPVDVLLGWAILWGALASLLAPGSATAMPVLIALGLDLLVMPHCRPLCRLGRHWLAGELAALLVCFLPAQFLCRWTADRDHLTGRCLLQTIAFTTLVGLLIPTIILTQTRGLQAGGRSIPSILGLQILFLIAIPGYAAVEEFRQRGAGTPLPYDPPGGLVSTGPYAFLKNPMQVSTSVGYLALALILRNLWFAAGGLILAAYSAGLARWHEESQLTTRFGDSWRAYSGHVPSWIPTWRPFVSRDCLLYVAQTCLACSALGRWIQARNPRGLLVLAAETHPTSKLARLTYETADGFQDQGVAAFARALEHIHLGWAFVGWTIRLQPIRAAVQAVMDCVGAGPRDLSRIAEMP